MHGFVPIAEAIALSDVLLDQEADAIAAILSCKLPLPSPHRRLLTAQPPFPTLQLLHEYTGVRLPPPQVLPSGALLKLTASRPYRMLVTQGFDCDLFAAIYPRTLFPR